MLLKTWLLCTGAGSNLRNRILGEIEKDSFIVLPGKRLPPPTTVYPNPGGLAEEFYSNVSVVRLLTRWGCVPCLRRSLLIFMSFFVPLVLPPWKKSYHQPTQHNKSRDITLVTKVHLVKANGFSSSHVYMWELEYKESWAPKNWYFSVVVLEKTLESPLDCKEIQSVHPKGNQSWIFIGRTDAESETPILWPPDAKRKTLMLGKIEGGRRRGRKRMRQLDGPSPAQWTWVWASYGIWWRTGKPGVLRSMRSQRVGRTEPLNWVLPQVGSWLLLPWWAIVWICPLELQEGHPGWNLPHKKQEKKSFRSQEPTGHCPHPSPSQHWDFSSTDVCFEEFTVSFIELYSYVLCTFLCVCALLKD